MKLKILHIASDDLWGGAEAQIELLIRNLNISYSEQICCDLLTFNQGRLHLNLKQICNAQVADEKSGLFSLLKKAINIGKLLQPNIIVSHGYKEAIVGFILSFITQSKWVHQFHGSSEGYQGPKFIKAKIYNFLEINLVKLFSNSIVVISNSTLNSLGLSNTSKVHVIYNAANTPTRLLDNHLSNSHKIFVIGRLAPVKRIDLAIEAIASCIKSNLIDSPIELHIIGDGPEMEASISKVKSSKITSSVFFHGFIEKPFELVKDKNSLLLLTSDSEGIPTVILEAMHLGIPIITRDVGGIAEIKAHAEDYPLVLVNNHKINELPQLIKSALNTIDKLNSQAKDCDTGFFKVERYLKEHVALYQTL